MSLQLLAIVVMASMSTASKSMSVSKSPTSADASQIVIEHPSKNTDGHIFDICYRLYF